jgi:hypothetical protein
MRTIFRAEFVRYGSKSSFTGWPVRTLLFKDVKLDGKIVTDHLWFTMTKGFGTLGTLEPGDLVDFHARVTEYAKGYRGHRDDVDAAPIGTDYRLSRPTMITRVK